MVAKAIETMGKSTAMKHTRERFEIEE